MAKLKPLRLQVSMSVGGHRLLSYRVPLVHVRTTPVREGPTARLASYNVTLTPSRWFGAAAMATKALAFLLALSRRPVTVEICQCQ